MTALEAVMEVLESNSIDSQNRQVPLEFWGADRNPW